MSRKAAYQDDLKADILRHTLTLAGEDGWLGVSTRKIADRLQTSTTAIYHYFGNKDAILVELQREGFRKLRDAQVAVLEPLAGKPDQQLLAVSRAMLQFARKNAELYALMFNLDGAACQSDAHTEAAEGMKQIQTVLKQLTTDQAESVFLHWFATVHGFIAMTRHAGDSKATEQFDQLLTDAIHRFIKGL